MRHCTVANVGEMGRHVAGPIDVSGRGGTWPCVTGKGVWGTAPCCMGGISRYAAAWARAFRKVGYGSARAFGVHHRL